MFKKLDIFGKIPAEGTTFYLCYTTEKIYGLYHNTCLTWISKTDDITKESEIAPGIIVNYRMNIYNFTNYEKFAIMHEIGHYANGHVGTKEDIKPNRISILTPIIAFFKRKIEDEFIADEYATRELGKEIVLSALLELLNVKYINKREIEKRIVNIESKF